MTRRILRRGRYFGGQLQFRRVCSDLTMCEVEYSEVGKCKEHSHDRPFFALLLQGAYEESYLRQRVQYRPGTMTFRPAGIEHSDEIIAPKTRFFIIELDDTWEGRIREHSQPGDFVADALVRDASWLAILLYDVVKNFPACFPLLVEGIVLDLVLSAAGLMKRGRRPRWLDDVLGLIHSEFLHELRLGRAASHVKIHPAYLSRVFRKFFLQSMGHYVNRLRVCHACSELIKQRDAPLCDVALRSGFANQSHFTRIFKQIAGVTPGAFRAAGRDERRG